MKTPYQFHAGALKILEDKDKLKVVSTNYERFRNVPKYARKNRAFPTDVGIYNNDKDWDTSLKIKYCNGWSLQFSNSNDD